MNFHELSVIDAGALTLGILSYMKKIGIEMPYIKRPSVVRHLSVFMHAYLKLIIGSDHKS